MVLAGDTKQIINPSGFRWEEVRNKFFERGIQVPKVHALRINFRCVGSVVKLANALLDLKQRLIGLTGSEIKEEWKFNGSPPFLLNGLEEGKSSLNYGYRPPVRSFWSGTGRANPAETGPGNGVDFHHPGGQGTGI